MTDQVIDSNGFINGVKYGKPTTVKKLGVTAEYPSIWSYNPEKAGYMDTQLSPANALRTRNTYMSYLPCVC